MRGVLVAVLQVVPCVVLGCQPSAASVEASVQARVAATVTALGVSGGPVLTPTPGRPIRESLPYSVEGDGLRITLLSVGTEQPSTYNTPAAGYRFLIATLTYENLLNRDNAPPLPRCAGFADLRLRTDQDTIYRPRNTAAERPPGAAQYRPREVLTFTVRFEIRASEQPAELWAWQGRTIPQRGDSGCWRPGPDDGPELVFALSANAGR